MSRTNHLKGLIVAELLYALVIDNWGVCRGNLQGDSKIDVTKYPRLHDGQNKNSWELPDSVKQTCLNQNVML